MGFPLFVVYYSLVKGLVVSLPFIALSETWSMEFNQMWIHLVVVRGTGYGYWSKTFPIKYDIPG